MPGGRATTTKVRAITAPDTMADPTPMTMGTMRPTAGVAATPRPTTPRRCPMATGTVASSGPPTPITAAPIRSCGTTGIITTGDTAPSLEAPVRPRSERARLSRFVEQDIAGHHHPPVKKSCRSNASRGSAGLLVHRFACGGTSARLRAGGTFLASEVGAAGIEAIASRADCSGSSGRGSASAPSSKHRCAGVCRRQVGFAPNSNKPLHRPN